MEEGKNAFKLLTGKPTGKISLGGPRRRWVENNRMGLEEIGINAGNWVYSALGNAAMKSGFHKLWS